MKIYYKILVALLLGTLLANATRAQQLRTSPTSDPRAVATRSAQVHLVKFVVPGVFGNAASTEEKFGNIGADISTPISPLTLQTMIATTLGGQKFPDGTEQKTVAAGNAPLFSIAHDATLNGNGTVATPLGIAAGGIGTIQLANNAVTAAKLANGTVVRSLNGLFDNVNVAAGANITITSTGNTLTIAAPNALNTVAHDATLIGDGSTSSPLSVSVPLTLRGSAIFGPVLNVTPTAESGIGIISRGGNSVGAGGTGLVAQGGNSTTSVGGRGIRVTGGDGDDGGEGVSIDAGSAITSGFGGNGISVIGGFGKGTGKQGGTGLIVVAGGGLDGATNGKAGLFFGDVSISGNLSKGGGSFKIDHPLDPENKYLYHSFVESPDMKNIYDGTITTDGNGEATVTLPDWFEALNQDFRYQLTVIGTFAQAIVAQKIKGNRFVVKTNAPNVEVSWQVTGIRHDAYANKNRIPVEELKPEDERGLLLHPDAFNQPEEKGVQFVKIPLQIDRVKAARETSKQRQQ